MERLNFRGVSRLGLAMAVGEGLWGTETVFLIDEELLELVSKGTTANNMLWFAIP